MSEVEAKVKAIIVDKLGVEEADVVATEVLQTILVLIHWIQ